MQCADFVYHDRYKIEQLIKVFDVYQSDGVIIGWLDIYVRPPEINTYVDVKWSDTGGEMFERLVTDDLVRRMRQRGGMWRPFIK